jgi:hypothetical protein
MPLESVRLVLTVNRPPLPVAAGGVEVGVGAGALGGGALAGVGVGVGIGVVVEAGEEVRAGPP